MSISMECYYYSTLAVGRLVSQAARFLLAALRWLLLLYPCDCWWPATTGSSSSSDVEAEARAHRRRAAAVREGLRASTYGELAGADEAATCAVCLGEVQGRDSVWELGNCRHVFHKGCLDRWLDHDERLTCPLCRAPLLVLGVPPPPPPPRSPPEPSWPVERLLYLFGEDMLLAPSSSS